MSGESSDEPKPIVDEDWKSRVESERGRPASDDPPLPAPSFSVLVSTLVTQTLAAMGQIPDPIAKAPVVRPNLTKHMIDTLAMLQEKTKGNLSPQEAQMLDSVLHELRLAFVARQRASGGPA